MPPGPASGRPYNPGVTTESLWRAWSFQPLVVGGGIVAIAFFLHGWSRLHRRRAGLAPWTRIPLFVAGVSVTVLAIVSPIDYIGERYLQWVHMLQHVLIADLGVVLLLLAVRGPLAVFFLPRNLIAALARMRALRRTLSFLLRPGVSYGVWVAVLVGWHIPPLYEAALHHRAVHDLEHLSFVLGGLLVWTQMIDPSRHERLSLAERLGYTALVFWTGQVLAYVILFSFEPLFSTYAEEPRRLLGLSPLSDQKLAGLVMMLEQTLTVGTCFLVLLRASRRRLAAVAVGEHRPA
ncbi:putative membrane protein [Gaiella occulta]|uniref:Putative membrane protein n=1 Tax=Gaiella occulta TaxID=1002870 RepID=A0A7M2YZV4_9ACTN|nr:putative membrane protein [Gaiella occulta]